MLIRDNDDATIGACYTMKNQLQDAVYNTCGQPVQKNYWKIYPGTSYNDQLLNWKSCLLNVHQA